MPEREHYQGLRASYPPMQLGIPQALLEPPDSVDLIAAAALSRRLIAAIHPDATVSEIRAVLNDLTTVVPESIADERFGKHDVAYRDYFRLIRVRQPFTALVVATAQKLADVLADIEANDSSLGAIDVFSLISGSLTTFEHIASLDSHSTQHKEICHAESKTH